MKFSEALCKFNEWRNLKVGEGTVKGYDISLKYFCIFIKNTEIENIKLDDCLEWLKWFKELNFDINTIQKKAIALKIFFEFWWNQGKQIINPVLIPLPPKQFKFPRVACEEDYKKVLAVIPENSNYYWHIRNKALITLLWDCGARIGELLSLNVQDIDTINKRADIHTEKSKGFLPFRRIFWTNSTNQNLIKWIEKRKQELTMWNLKEVTEPDAFFISIHGGKGSCVGKATRMHKSAVTEMIRKYSNKAGLERTLNPHSIRHHRGRELALKGANNSTISSILGHSNLLSSYPYTVLAGKDLEKQFRKYVNE